jgi:hypothetical protein
VNDPEFLRGLAQNDYNIDGKFLPEGHTLYQIADRIEVLQECFTQMRKERDLLWEDLERLTKQRSEPLDQLAKLDEKLGLQ